MHIVAKEKIYLDVCDQGFKYVFKILKDKTIPFEEKEKTARMILTKYLDLKTLAGRLSSVLCLVVILSLVANRNLPGFYSLLKNIIKAIREEKITQAMAQYLIRKL